MMGPITYGLSFNFGVSLKRSHHSSPGNFQNIEKDLSMTPINLAYDIHNVALILTN